MTKEKTLEQRCDELDFHMELLGNTYCSLAYFRPVDCPYLSETVDHNDLLPCKNPKYYSLENIEGDYLQ